MALNYDIRAMLRKFGVVTVMDVKAYKTVLFAESNDDYEAGEWNAVETLAADPVFTLDTLKIANINQEGPTKTITGGQNADTLLKYGKTLTMEMQEALGRYDVLHEIYGVNYSDNHQIASFTDRFPSELTLVGTTFVIDQATGAKQPIHIVIPRFLGDGIFNLTQDAEGDATVFDLNGNVLKFEGGLAGAEPVGAAGWNVALNHANHAWDGMMYKAGADNEFYFMCTKDILPIIKQQGYRAAGTYTGAAAN
jgi:hypothetical protein